MGTWASGGEMRPRIVAFILVWMGGLAQGTKLSQKAAHYLQQSSFLSILLKLQGRKILERVQ